MGVIYIERFQKDLLFLKFTHSKSELDEQNFLDKSLRNLRLRSCLLCVWLSKYFVGKFAFSKYSLVFHRVGSYDRIAQLFLADVVL